MSVIHLSTRSGILCRSTRRNPRVSTDLQYVTCSWCFHTLERVSLLETDEAFLRGQDAQWAAAADTLGVREFWDSLSTASATERLMRNILGSVFVGLVESRAEATQAAS